MTGRKKTVKKKIQKLRKLLEEAYKKVAKLELSSDRVEEIKKQLKDLDEKLSTFEDDLIFENKTPS